jgi:hypothetical protein
MKPFTVWKADYTTRKTEFYDLNGSLIKVMTTDKVKLLDKKNKKYQPVEITMRTNRTTVPPGSLSKR